MILSEKTLRAAESHVCGEKQALCEEVRLCWARIELLEGVILRLGHLGASTPEGLPDGDTVMSMIDECRRNHLKRMKKLRTSTSRKPDSPVKSHGGVPDEGYSGCGASGESNRAYGS